MKSLFVRGISLACLLLVVFELQAVKQIAITFDDAPRPDTSLTSAQRTQALLIALDASGVDQAMFFVTTKHLNDENRATLNQYQQDGHLIANHSDLHLWLHKTETAVYQQDILNAHEQLKNFEHFRPFFRYPYLDEGRDKKVSKKIAKFLQKQGYRNGYVTVDNYDWYLDRLYQDAIKAGKEVNMVQLKKLYIDVLWEAISHSDNVAEKYLGRSPKHVLLLHDNDLAAFFIDDLVLHLREQGWEIISPTEAYQDPIAQQEPKTLFTGQGRVAALARDAGAKTEELVHVAEDEAKLAELFAEYKVATELGAVMPAWFKQKMASQVGTWKASNAQYQSETVPFSDFVIEWSWGIGEQSLNGRLYGINNDKPTYDFWTYKQYWDPAINQARLLQFGLDGRVGDGYLRDIGNGQIESIQTFSAAEIAPYQEKHLSLLTPEGLLTTAFELNDQGQWQGRRSYTWIKQPPPTE